MKEKKIIIKNYVINMLKKKEKKDIGLISVVMDILPMI